MMTPKQNPDKPAPAIAPNSAPSEAELGTPVGEDASTMRLEPEVG